MSDQLRRTLCDIVAVHGPAVADDPKCCAEMLRAASPNEGPGIDALLRALEAHVPARLALLTEAAALAPMTSELVQRLVADHGLSEEAARWAVDTWAIALGKTTEAGAAQAVISADRFMSGGGQAADPGAALWLDHTLAPPLRSRWRRLTWVLLPVAALLLGLGAWWWYEQRAELRRFVVQPDGITALSLSADGRLALLACRDKTLRLWNVETGTELRRFHGHALVPYATALSPDGRLALSCGGELVNRDGKLVPLDCELRLWDVDSGTELRRLGEPAVPLRGVAFAPDGQRAAAGGGGYEFKEAELVRKDGKEVPVGCVVRVWDMTRGTEVAKGEGHRDVVQCVAFTPDGRRVVSGGRDATVRVWDAATGRELRRMEVNDKAQFVCLAVSPDGRKALTGDSNSRLRLWDLEGGYLELEWAAHAQAIRGVAFAADGRRLLSGGDDYTLRLWDAETGLERRHYKGHASSLTGVAFLPDGRTALSASWDGTLRVWRLPP